MDKRQQKTRILIFETFINLLSKKSYGKITVSEIIKEANIGRSTFYSHFETKDDLLSVICTDMFNHVLSFEVYKECHLSLDFNSQNLRSITTHILYHLKENKGNIVRLLSSENLEFFYSYFYAAVVDMAKYLLNTRSKTDTVSLPEDFLINHFSISFIGMIQWWAKKDFDETPEAIAKYFDIAISPLI